ncbi:IS21 family transposase, partial [Actinospica sp. MGRD01-02]
MGLPVEELIRRVRRDREVEGLSIRALARKHRVGRKFVRRALASTIPHQRKTPERQAPVLGPFHEIIDSWLRQDASLPVKQRQTLVRMTARLREEHGCPAAYGAVRDYVGKRRRQLEAELFSVPAALPGFVPRFNVPGQDAEVDFGELFVRIGDQLVKCYLFVLRLCYSGFAIHRAYPSSSQEVFLDAHAHAFRVLGGVPAGQIRYDNLTPAVVSVVYRSRDRVENPRWKAFHEHHGLTVWYCQPGKSGAHEKGGVEGEIGYFRRTYLSPPPTVTDLDELNSMIDEWQERELHRHIGQRSRSIGQDFATEAKLLKPLPTEPFDTRLQLSCVTDRYAMINVRANRYSVPARFIGRRLRVMLGAEDLLIYHGVTEVARHRRLIARGEEKVELDHYLGILLGRPGALQGSRVLHHARAQGAFTSEHEAYWAKARKDLGDQDGTRALIHILLLHRHNHPADVQHGIRTALGLGTLSLDVIALETRKAAQAAGRAPTVTAPPGEHLQP